MPINEEIIVGKKGEILPKKLIELIDSGYNHTTQDLIWKYQNDNPTIVIGKTPLWSDLALPGESEIEVTLTATNIGFVNASEAYISDIIPEGYQGSRNDL